MLDCTDEKVRWAENDGSESFTTRHVRTTEGASTVALADLDGDGDMDGPARRGTRPRTTRGLVKLVSNNEACNHIRVMTSRPPVLFG